MKTLSIFIDESGDFGKYEHHAPYYLLSLVFHDQDIPISNKLYSLDTKLNHYYPDETKTIVHAGPIIRSEEIFRQLDLTERRHIFNALFSCKELFKKLHRNSSVLFDITVKLF